MPTSEASMKKTDTTEDAADEMHKEPVKAVSEAQIARMTALFYETDLSFFRKIHMTALCYSQNRLTISGIG